VAAGVALAAGGAAIGTWVAANDEYGRLRAVCYSALGCTEEDVRASPAGALETATNALWIGALVAGAGAVALFVIEGLAGEHGPAVAIGPGSIEVRGSF
jgi:hypothetical protein